MGLFIFPFQLGLPGLLAGTPVPSSGYTRHSQGWSPATSTPAQNRDKSVSFPRLHPHILPSVTPNRS